MTIERLALAMPLLLAMALAACATNGVQPGIVSSSGPPQGYYGQQGYGPAYGQNQGYQNASVAGGPVAGTTPLDPNDPANAANGAGGSYPQPAAASSGGSGRVVSINDISMNGGGGGYGGSGGGAGNGTLIGGLVGGLGGAAIGASGGRGLGGGLVGGLLGAVGGAVVGSIFDGQHGGSGGGGRGIEVTVQRDDGQRVTVAQRDDGDVQLGDRVQIVQGPNGAAQVVRDTARNPD